ncbi:MAG: hypothetical protein ABJE47_16210 [bacterium]
MRHVFVPRDADRYAAEVFQAKAEGGGPMMATGYTLAYVMMVSPELETRVRAHLGRRGTTAADIDALLERAKAFIASRNGERLTMDDPANGRTSLG